MTGTEKRTAINRQNIVSGGTVSEVVVDPLLIIALFESALLLGSFTVALVLTRTLADPAFLLGVIIDVSSVMVGFAGVTTIFVAQTTLEAERHTASQYLTLCLEVQKARSGTAERGATRRPALTDRIGPAREVIDQLETMLRREGNFRRFSLTISTFVVLSFTLSLLMSVVVALGIWNATWLPVSFFLLGLFNYPSMLGLFTLYLRRRGERPELELRKLTGFKTQD